MKSMKTAPIALFTYKRPDHARQTVAALQKNELADVSELFIFSDGPRSEADREQVRAVREYLRTVSGFGKVTVVERDRNLGLAQSIITGVTEIVGRYGRIIVLEDDMITSRYFLKFMNDALELYENVEDVISVHGYLFPVKARLPETFFLRGADCWGWGTWKRGWDLFEPDGRKLLALLKERKLARRFDYDGAYAYTKMLEDQVAGKYDSWAIRWYASAFVRDKLTLYPGKSLICNTGVDASGTHCKGADVYAAEVSHEPVRVERIPVAEDPAARKAIGRFLRSVQPSLAQKVAAVVRKVLGT